MNFLRSIIAGITLAVLTSGSALAQCGTTAPANKFCGNDTGASALATWKSIPAGALSAIAGGTVLGNRGSVATVPSPLTNPVLGIPGTSTGEVGLAGLTSGTAILRAQAVAGSAVVLLPTAAGTLVSTASSPLAVNATSGLMTCPTCVTSSGGGAITGAAPITVSVAGVVSINAPYVTLTASNGGIVYSGATNLAILAGTATARQMLQSGASTTPAWSTTTWPATSTINRILYSSAANVVGEITTANGGLLNTSSAGVPSITATPVLGVAGTTVGSIGFQNLTSGTVTLQPVTGALGGVTINVPAAAGTMAVSVSTPLSLSATTGALNFVGTSGGIIYFNGATSAASSGALASNGIVLGGGAGGSPSTPVGLGTTTTVLHGNAGGAPTYASVAFSDIATADIATGAQYLAGTASKLVQSGAIYQAETTTAFGSTTTFDLSTFINTNVTLTANITTQVLSNVIAGKAGTIRFTQSGAGSFTTVWSSVFKFAGGVAPALTTASATAIDVLSYNCITATYCQAALAKDVK